MRIAIVSAPASRQAPGGKSFAAEILKSLAKGMESMGHRADIIDAWTEDGMKLPAYEYIAVAAEPVSFFSGKIIDRIAKVLAAGSSVAGKKSAAFVIKKGLFYSRALSYLMRDMEAEGMVVNWSDFLLNPEHAQAMGKRIGA